MKCTNCGADLDNGVRFCRECGAQVKNDASAIRYCQECGAKIDAGTKFCPNCGAKLFISSVDETKREEPQASPENIQEKPVQENKGKLPLSGVVGSVKAEIDRIAARARTGEAPGKSFAEESKSEKAKLVWKALDSFYKVEVVLAIIAILLVLVSLLSHWRAGTMLSILQLVCLAVAALYHMGFLKSKKAKIKYIWIAIAVLLTLVNAANNPSNQKRERRSGSSSAVSTTQSSKTSAKKCAAPGDAASYIGKNYEKVVREFSSAGFKGIEAVALEDLDESSADQNGAVEAVTINDKNDFKAQTEYKPDASVVITYHSFPMLASPISPNEAGTYSSEDIKDLFVSAGFTNVTVSEVQDLDPDKSSAEAVNEVTIGGKKDFSKGECVAFNSPVSITKHLPFSKYTVNINVDFIGNIFFNKYDVDVSLDGIKQEKLAHGTDGDFSFRLKAGEHTIAFSKAYSSSPTKEVALQVDCDIDAAYKISCYSDSITVEEVFADYKRPMEDDEAKVDGDEKSFRGKNYSETIEDLTKLGFTNITAVPVYDIIFDESSIEKTSSVTINGSTAYRRGDVFKKDAEVIVSYRMLAEDDPTRQTEPPVASPTPTATPVPTPVDPLIQELEGFLPKDAAKRAVVVAFTNNAATDVFSSDGNHYDSSKFHGYDYSGEFKQIIKEEGTWSAVDAKTWHVEDMYLLMRAYNQATKLSCNITFDETNYTVSSVNYMTALPDYIDTEDPSKTSGWMEMEPSDDYPYLIIPKELIGNVEVSTPAPSPTPKDTVLTVENDERLAEFLSASKMDSSSQASFVREYKGRVVEFDCVVVSLEPTTKWICTFVLAPGKSSSSIGAARFILEDASLATFKWDSATRPEYLTEGSKLRMRAKIETGSDSEYISLKPIESWGR